MTVHINNTTSRHNFLSPSDDTDYHAMPTTPLSWKLATEEIHLLIWKLPTGYQLKVWDRKSWTYLATPPKLFTDLDAAQEAGINYLPPATANKVRTARALAAAPGTETPNLPAVIAPAPPVQRRTPRPDPVKVIPDEPPVKPDLVRVSSKLNYTEEFRKVAALRMASTDAAKRRLIKMSHQYLDLGWFTLAKFATNYHTDAS